MKLNSNPYSSPKLTHTTASSASSKPSIRHMRWGIYFASAIAISAIPIYGFYTDAARDSQNTVLWIMLAWTISLTNAFACLIRSIVLLRTNGFHAIVGIVVSLILVGMLFAGFYGIGDAIAELWAG